jgi:hypothetical protein
VISFTDTQASLLATPYGSSSLGPSRALSYAVGFVPHILQLQAKDRGFHLETSLSTLQVSTRNKTLQAGSRPHSLRHRHRHRPVRLCQQQVRVSLDGAS